MAKIAGRYPGGPRREPLVAVESRPRPRLSTVNEIEERMARGAVRHRQQRRKTRVLMGLAGTVVAALAAGDWIGLKSHQSTEDITAELGAETDGGVLDLAGERDRILRELWKMEEMERLPQRR